MAIKGIGHPKIKLLSLFTHPHVMLYGFKTIYGPQNCLVTKESLERLEGE